MELCQGSAITCRLPFVSNDRRKGVGDTKLTRRVKSITQLHPQDPLLSCAMASNVDNPIHFFQVWTRSGGEFGRQAVFWK